MPRGLILVLLSCISLLTACSGGASDDDVPLFDADGDAGADGDLPLSDGDDQPLPDGDAPADGDEPTDGDNDDEIVDDGDITEEPEIPDGDVPDGDIPDGDILDGDVPDGDTPTSWRCDSFGYDLQEGVNQGFSSAGKTRNFTLVLPDDIDTVEEPLPVLFFFYGSGGNMADWVTAFQVRSNVNKPDFPFIGIVPESLGLFPPGKVAFDWDSLVYDDQNPDANVDAAFVGDLLACLQEAFPVDVNHIHAAGFSAGAFMANLCAVAYPDLFASVAAFSGAYFSDPAQTACVIGMCAEWTPYAGENKFPALLVWGTKGDTYSLVLMTFDFAATGQASIDYLTGMGHDVVACTHDYDGHVYPTPLSPWIYAFFKAHPYGTVDTPFADALPAAMQDACAVHEGE
ncbi:MAG: hypothetical protein C4523_03365 [Myxococcales bacterium]|nr:MAG: hypothetical protein C4523_03365 [Myxococcales bacterium]